MIDEKENIINYLQELYRKNGMKSLSENNLRNTNYYNYIKKLNLKNIDFQEFCSILIDKHDDYIIHISVCED